MNYLNYHDYNTHYLCTNVYIYFSHINSDDQLHNKYKYKKGNICINERNKMIQFYEKEM